jgi:hypothetical protein
VSTVLKPIGVRGVERLLPHSVEAEQSVLGGLLLDNSRWPVVAGMLAARSFFNEEHQLIYSAIEAIVRSGAVADVITVYEHLRCSKLSDVAGGLKYLNELAQSVPSAANIKRYAEIVLNHASMRGIIEIGNAATREALNAEGKSATQVIAALMGKLHVLGASACAGKSSTGVDAAELLALSLPDPAFVCSPFVPEGLTLVAAPPKTGKTTLMRQLIHAANHGGDFLGSSCRQADVLFLSLEEGVRLMRKKLVAMNIPAEELQGVRIEFDWPMAAEGVVKLREWLKARAPSNKPPLVIIDSLARFRLPPSSKGNAFAEDYAAVKLLADLCKEFAGLSIVVLHHTTKARQDDPMAMISGTFGISAGIDSYIIMLRQTQAFRLHAGGRLWDSDNQDFRLERVGGRWEFAGEWDNLLDDVSPKQRAVLELLKGGTKTGKALEQATGQSASSLSHMLRDMARSGLVTKVSSGWVATQ